MMTILFVCLHGSAKSIIAAAHLTRLAAARGLALESVAAGLKPDPFIPTHVMDGLAADCIDVSGSRPVLLSAGMASHAWRIVSFGCELPGVNEGERRVTHWDDVPAVSDDYAAARDVIVARLHTLLDELKG